MTDDANLNLEADIDDAAQPEGEGDEDLVMSLRNEIIELKDQMLRVRAEAENTKRRAEREANDTRAFAIQKFAKDLVDASDNLARALLAAPKDSADPAVKNLVTGIDMTEKALQTAFERNGLKKVAPERGARFDPHYHQAMMEQPDPDIGPGAITMVMQAGYELFGRVVRPALVAVTPKTQASASASASSNGYAGAAGASAGASVDSKA